jgi:lactate dehydrogenase-like 2-hydroxyacid dehydrogenase
VQLPHLRNAALETRCQMAAIAAANVQAVLRGDRLLTPVFGQVWSHSSRC